MAYTKAGIRFSNDSYVLVDAESVTKRKLLFENPDISQEMTGITLFYETELEGYDFISFIVTGSMPQAWSIRISASIPNLL